MIFAAIDWAEQSHHLLILDADGRQLESQRIDHHYNGFHKLDALLMRHAEPGDVCVAIELHAGVLVDWLLQRPYHVYGINPKSAERARDRFYTSRPERRHPRRLVPRRVSPQFPSASQAAAP